MLRAQMAYCGPKGIPLSEFLSWHVDDQNAALGWMAEESQKCSHCGTYAWEWENNPQAYEATTSVCLGCNAIGSLQKQSKEHAQAFPGLQFYLKKPEVHSGD